MNISMNSLNKFYISNKFPLIKVKEEYANAEEYVKELEIKTPKLTTKAGSLSGGNQQKVSIAKWLSAQCDICLLYTSRCV